MFIKRFLDIMLSLALLILTSPIILIVSLLIRIKLGSPVVFKQMRPGYNYKPFYIYKFRTMLELKDEKGEYLPDKERLTRFGIFLRKFSLDEFPQLVNVLKGDMSLVGPRPLLMKYLPYYRDYEKNRFQVRPGITGWAQINGRNAVTWDEKFKLDAWYVDNWSLWLDFKILILTFYKVIKSENVKAIPPDSMEDLDMERDYAKSHNIKFRKAIEEDSAAITHIVRNSYSPEVTDILIYGCDKFENYLKDSLSQFDENYLYIVAEEDKKILGYVELRLMPSILFLNYIAVLSEYHSKSIGHNLLKYAIKNYSNANCKYVELDVFSFNTSAINWYRNLGFEKTNATKIWTFDLNNILGVETPPKGTPHNFFVNERYKKYTFSSFNISTRTMNYSIGLLGTKWYKISHLAPLKDTELLNSLIQLDPKRKLLVFIEDDDFSDDNLTEKGKKEFDLIRMRAPIEKVYRALNINEH